ncbi:MAG TPA: type IV secretion system DNA-binding domain-containing protein [Candidatus Saccharimonadales bacterium]|nr:type IV secretion system DNA-binding domain-containing protein [Candidatus Saccharimonadales bacterium]
MTIFSWLLGLISIWWVWLPIVLILLYLTFQNHRRIKHIDTLEHVVLRLEVPRTNDKREPAAEQVFTSLHGILRTKKELITSGDLQEHLSFEMVAESKRITFYLWTPKHLQNFVESQIYAQYPSLQIQEVSEDYAARKLEGEVFHATELALTSKDALPLKTYDAFDGDPLLALTTTLSKLEQTDEEYWVQIITRPVDSRWQQRSEAFVRRLKNGRSHLDMTDVLGVVGQFVGALWKPPEQSSGSSEVQLTENDRLRIEAAEKKATKPGYQVKIRLAYVGNDEQIAKMRLQTLVGAFKQFNAPNLNGFMQKNASSGTDGFAAYKARFFIDKGFILNVEELASLFHLPHSEVTSASVAWAKAKVAEPPRELPALTGDQGNDGDISAFAATNFRGVNQQFGIYRGDRDRHVYIIGQTGVGKSKLLELFALSDLYHNQGYAIIDPHGDFAINNLYFIPPSRMKDVIYFNPADTDFPIGFNPMEIHNVAFKGRVSAELVNVLKHLFGNTWNTKLEYMLRYIMLALLETPGTTMIDITRMLTDSAFREAILTKVTDPVVRSFWADEFNTWKESYANETVSPILNKVGAFTANPIIRNIVGQTASTFNLREVMDGGKIFIANLSGGLLGEENAALLGSLLITKIQQAAMSRTDPQNRRPFYLYVDEFQNFATDSFVPILSEARKYGLSMTMANQYINQMSPVVRDAVFGNVGSLITFRVSPDDANALSEYFSPRFDATDLTQLHNRNFAVAMAIRGEKTPAFSGTTLALPIAQQNYIAEITAHTRTHFAHPREEVEKRLQRAAAPIAAPAVLPAIPARTTTTPSDIDPKKLGRLSVSPTAPPRKHAEPAAATEHHEQVFKVRH